MSLLSNDSASIDRILQHIDRKTTDVGTEIWREPVSHYTSPERFDAELGVMRRTPTPFCPSAALPKPGSYIARDAARIPIVAVRGQDGKVRAFRNACRHRGMQVATGAGCKSALTCRYHAWSYALDGSLRGIPHPEGFPQIDRAQHGLVPVNAVERNGLVYVTQDGSEALPSAEDGVAPDLFGESFRYIDVTELETAANWKIVTEGVLEGYHIRSTHSETFYPRQYDNLNLVDAFGRNTRVTYPFQNIERLRGASPEERSARGCTTQVFHLFPNTMLATFPTHTVLSVFEPLAIDRTMLVTYTLTDVADEELVRKARAFVDIGLEEDRNVQSAVQRGVAARANDAFTFGLFESGIVRFHRHLTEALGSDQSP